MEEDRVAQLRTQQGDRVDETAFTKMRFKFHLRINQMVALGFSWPEEKVVNNIQRYGNTTAASIPLALYEAIEAGRVHDGDLICLAGFGAGFTWGAILIRW